MTFMAPVGPASPRRGDGPTPVPQDNVSAPNNEIAVTVTTEY